MSAARRDRTPRGWSDKFRDAFRGLWLGVRDQSSFRVHGVFAIAVAVLAGLLRVGMVAWCLLILCITVVLSAELFNTALESLARAVDRQENPYLGKALDVASAAVLTSAIGAALVGMTLFLHRLGALLSW